jgi:hypothetical protein
MPPLAGNTRLESIRHEPDLLRLTFGLEDFDEQVTPGLLARLQKRPMSVACYLPCCAADAGDALFSPADSDDISPLSITRMSRRRAELRALTEYLLRDQPGARSVRGTSWLYNLEAYRRLFPPAYAASCRLNGQTLRYQGNALWGQFLSFRGEVKAAPRQRMLANLLDLDARRPWLTFPLPALTPEAPLAVFAEHYAED